MNEQALVPETNHRDTSPLSRYRKALLEISGAFAATTETGVLFRILTDVIGESLHSHPILIYLFCRELGTYQDLSEDSSFRDYYPSELQSTYPVIELLLASDQVIAVPQPWHRKANCNSNAQMIELAVPVMADGYLHGLILLGRKRSGECYSHDDTEFLYLVGKLTAISLDNARHFEELRQIRMVLEQLVEDRTSELALANQQLQEADRAKDRFLATLSHELKNPLTCILSWAELARISDDPATTAKALTLIEQNALRQRHLLNDLLDLSRIIHGKMALDLTSAPLWPLVLQSVESLQQDAKMRRIELITDHPGDPLIVSGDRMRLLQVINNVLDNALKFTPPGGTISITGQHRDKDAVIIISDTGCGIPAEQLNKIFSPFEQARKDTTGAGMGLGLSLVKGFVELHGGQVKAFSAGENAGTTITITLPCSPG